MYIIFVIVIIKCILYVYMLSYIHLNLNLEITLNCVIKLEYKNYYQKFVKNIQKVQILS